MGAVTPWIAALANRLVPADGSPLDIRLGTSMAELFPRFPGDRFQERLGPDIRLFGSLRPLRGALEGLDVVVEAPCAEDVDSLLEQLRQRLSTSPSLSSGAQFDAAWPDAGANVQVIRRPEPCDGRFTVEVRYQRRPRGVA